MAEEFKGDSFWGGEDIIGTQPGVPKEIPKEEPIKEPVIIPKPEPVPTPNKPDKPDTIPLDPDQPKRKVPRHEPA